VYHIAFCLFNKVDSEVFVKGLAFASMTATRARSLRGPKCMSGRKVNPHGY
jgi:hypothetical protein